MYHNPYIQPPRRRYGLGSFLLDLFLTFLTGGIWLIYKLFKFLTV